MPGRLRERLGRALAVHVPAPEDSWRSLFASTDGTDSTAGAGEHHGGRGPQDAGPDAGQASGRTRPAAVPAGRTSGPDRRAPGT
jgi:hypothetical protein